MSAGQDFNTPAQIVVVRQSLFLRHFLLTAVRMAMLGQPPSLLRMHSHDMQQLS